MEPTREELEGLSLVGWDADRTRQVWATVDRKQVRIVNPETGAIGPLIPMNAIPKWIEPGQGL